MILAMMAAALLSSLLILPWIAIICGPICILFFAIYPCLIGIFGLYRWIFKPSIIVLDSPPPQLLLGKLVTIKSIK